MELFDRHARIRRGVGDIPDEPFELEHSRKSVLRPQMRGKLAAVGSDEHELHLVPDHCVDTRVRQSCLDPAQSSATAIGIRRAVLIEESAGRPAQSVAENAQRAEIDPHTLISHHADGIAEHDAGLIDGEDVPDRAGAESGVGEGAHPAQRNGLGVREARRIDDGADQRDDTVGLELGDGGCGERFGGPRRHSAIVRGVAGATG